MQNARLCIAYLPFGAGLKGKVLDGMKNGTPCAMNAIASEGMFGKLMPNGIIEDDIDVFVDCVSNLYQDKNVWNDYQNNGFQTLKTRFNRSNFEALFINQIEALQQQLKTHRQQHFLGQVLQHHSMQSSKYMSKWIEEKNK